MVMIKRLGLNLVFGILMATLFLGSDWLFAYFLPKYTFALNSRRFMGFWFLFFLLSLVKSRRFIWGFLIWFEGLILFEMINLSIYQSLASPFSFYLFYMHFSEVVQGSVTYASFLVKPIAFSIAVFALAALILTLTKKRRRLPFMGPFLLFLILFFPLRSYSLQDKFGARADAHASLFYNAYSTSSNFLTHVVPKRFFGKGASENSADRQPFPTIVESHPNRNVIVVVGESVGFKYLSLFGYEKQTTPFLETLRDDPQFLYRKGLSCGVATNVSVPLFMNLLCEPQASAKIASERTCLFKMAKDNGFTTHYYTAHSGDSMKGIFHYYCPGFIDHYKGAYEIQKETNYFDAVRDKRLIEQLEQVDFSKSNLIVLQQQSSHAPYEANYPPEFAQFNHPNDSQEEKVRHSFLNSLLYTDSFFQELFGYVKTHAQGETVLLFISDHGEAQGEEGRWGHLELFPEQYQVPFFFYSFDQTPLPEAVQQLSKRKEFVTALEVGRLAGHLLGYQMLPLRSEPRTIVMGKDIEGSDGFLEIEFEGETMKKIVRKVVE